MNDFLFSFNLCFSLQYKVHFQLVNYMCHYLIRKTTNPYQRNCHCLQWTMFEYYSIDFVMLPRNGEHTFDCDDDEYN